MEENKTIFCLLGKSASGKDTLINMITSSNSNVSKLIPTTTREKRKYEKDGYDYHFISENAFIKKIEKNQFMEHRKYVAVTQSGTPNTLYYGTEYPQGHSSILTGPVDMYEKIKNNLLNSSGTSNKINVIPIYIQVPDDERLYRMIRRESRNNKPNYREVARRFLADNREFNEEYMKSLGINETNTFINLDKDLAAKQINEFINSTLFPDKK